eukprot:CAMPEP_0180046998 /NCGR_PEP_ID=MMETSP0984-20121128/37519_1 /TAXON_ID=483367 /ORGANISM="non described non described, Strain CCMP 2436" /LENGTH=76 /DNA_ID=CAMNT_0021975797 /DNA_START=250 /DNA_END=476 /DNA_ORIENTATION=+
MRMARLFATAAALPAIDACSNASRLSSSVGSFCCDAELAKLDLVQHLWQARDPGERLVPIARLVPFAERAELLVSR